MGRCPLLASCRPSLQTITTLNRTCLYVLSLVLSLATSCRSPEGGFVPLFNGESLEGWVSARALADDESAFSVNVSEKAIHVYAGQEAGSKQTTDCLMTSRDYSDFVLKLEYKWLGKRFAPRSEWDRDAGLLFHVHGDLKRIWPLCLEMQMGESSGDKASARGAEGRFHSGDLFVLGKDLRVDCTRDGGFYDPEAASKTGRSCPTRLGVERPPGSWNELEIRVHGSTKATFVLNGQVVHEITNMTTVDEEGATIPLGRGRIGLQAEWAELLYRNIRIMELKPGVL